MLLSTTACQQKQLAVRTEYVEVPHRQYVALPSKFTTVEPEPVAPSAECVVDGKPVRCNRQLREMLDDALEWGRGLADQINDIVELQGKAIEEAAAKGGAK